MHNILIVGSSGSIGKEFVLQISSLYKDYKIYSLSQSDIKWENKNIVHHIINYKEENTIEEISQKIPNNIDTVIITNGILTTDNITPEKSIKEFSYHNFQTILHANTFIPAVIAKYFLPKMIKNNRSKLVILSARIGSISDNKLGGWYSYRISKAGVNMLVKNLSIESKRYNKDSIVIAIHPGTVDSPLSKPFQNNIDPKKIFTPQYSVEQMINVILKLKTEDSGKCFAWDGNQIKP